MQSRTYRSVSVKDIRISEILSRLSAGPVCVGLDVGKDSTMVVIRDAAGTFFRPWKVHQLSETRLLCDRLKELSVHRPMIVALEPTGTYGDPLRQALGDAGLTVHRVSPKASSDYSEVFDGVPSQHDGKDAAVVAELAAIGKSSPWREHESVSPQMRQLVQWMDTQQDILMLWLGRLEAGLARHWPELTGLLDLNSSTLLRILQEYGGPQAVCRNFDEARLQISRWGGSKLKSEKIEAVMASAKSTIGVRMTEYSEQFIRNCAAAAFEARRLVRSAQSELRAMAESDDALRRVGEGIGLVTACVLFVAAGNPRDYSSGAAFRKALGLNLKERSSGRHQGKLKITKRGPSIARRWLYMAALRMIQDPHVKPWYEQKKSRSEQRGGKALVGVMRKLSLAIYSVAGGAKFEASRLFPGVKCLAKGN